MKQRFEVGQKLTLLVEVNEGVWREVDVIIRAPEGDDEPDEIAFEEGVTVLAKNELYDPDAGDDCGEEEFLELEVLRLDPDNMTVELYSSDIGGLDTVNVKIKKNN